MPGTKKSVPAEKTFCQGRIGFRGATLFHEIRALSEILTYLRQLTHALRCGILPGKPGVRRTLSGPFGKLHLGPFSPARTLFARIFCFDLRFNGFLD